MKVLKILGIIVLVIVVLVAVLALIAPKSYHVERTIVINAPTEVVFRQIQFWRNWSAWSPWAEMDSTMTVTVEGIDGQPGSKYIWEGDPKITGQGEMTNTGITQNEEILYHLHFILPWESESDGWMRLSDAASGVQAAWGFSGKYPMPMNIMLLFMNMEKMMAPDFDRGLELLKEISEDYAANLASYESSIEHTTMPAKRFAAVRQEVKMTEMTQFFESSFAAIMGGVEASGATMIGAPAGLHYTWDEEKGVTDMAAAIPVRGNVTAENVTMIETPRSKALVITHEGPYESLELAHIALNMYVQKNGLAMKEPVMEEYLTDPSTEPDPNKWLTRIIYMID